MGNLNLTASVLSNMENNVERVEIPHKDTDGATGSKDYTYLNPNWTKQYGLFYSIPDLKAALLMKATWNVGKGFIADPRTTVILDHISGWGKDTFLDILFNLEVTKRIGGDAFAEIIRSEKGDLLNLKILNPGSIRIHVNEKGILDHYEQVSRIAGQTMTVKKFQPEDILHLCHNRLADQVHGISDIDVMEKTILAENESFEDLVKIMHRQAKPMIMFKVGTDDPNKLADFQAKMDKATNKGENIFIPFDENTVSYEVVQVTVSQIVMEWRNDLKNRFYRAIGLPLVIFGSAASTESGSKIEYLAHEQIFEKDQKEIEEQIWNQLGLRINLLPPTSLMDNLQQDASKDGAMQGMNMQPNDTNPARGE